MRNLITIRTVSEIHPIEKADRIEIAVVDGWQCVVKKGQFSVGDKGLYAEIDSFLPAHDARFSFLGKPTNWKDRVGYRLRTMKLRGTLSQGLLLPLSDFPEVVEAHGNADYAEILDVVKWERELPACLAGKVAGNFPSFIRKTDQERIQNLTGRLDTILTTPFEITVKLDGSSMTSFIKDGNFGVCSRNLEIKLEDDTNTFVQTFKRENHMEILALLKDIFGFDVAMQGELMGPGIQGNRENLAEHQFFLFDIFNIDSGVYLSPEQRIRAIQILNNKGFKIAQVPLVAIMGDNGVPETLLDEGAAYHDVVQKILAMAEGPSLMNPVREGIVFKSLQPDARGNIFSFKAISNTFLLQGGD